MAVPIKTVSFSTTKGEVSTTVWVDADRPHQGDLVHIIFDDGLWICSCGHAVVSWDGEIQRFGVSVKKLRKLRKVER